MDGTEIKTKLEKLPKWAQEHIQQMERERNCARKELIALLDRTTTTNVYVWSRALNIGDKHFIQTDRVEFALPNGEVQVAVEDGELRLMARGPCTQIQVMPSVTNVIRIRLTNR